MFREGSEALGLCEVGIDLSPDELRGGDWQWSTEVSEWVKAQDDSRLEAFADAILADYRVWVAVEQAATDLVNQWMMYERAGAMR